METEITVGNYLDNIFEGNKIAFKLYSKKILISIAVNFLLGIFFLVDGIRKGYDISSTTTEYRENTNTVIKNVTYSNHHINTDIGAALIIVSLLILYDFYRGKRFVNRAAIIYYSRHKSPNHKCIIKINEQSIFYQNFEFTADEKWSRISKYKIASGYIFLIRDNSYLDSIPIKISEIEKNKFEDLMTFIRQRIVEKK